MGAPLQTFAILCLLLLVKAEKVTVRLPQVSLDPNGQCHLPDVINIEVLLQGQWNGIELELTRKDVIPRQRTIYVMRQDENEVTWVEQLELPNDKYGPIQSYHDHKHGAAFTVTCTNQGLRGQMYALEGSLYRKGQKFRLSPSAIWQQEAEVLPDHVMVIYNLNEIQDFQPGDSAAIAATSQGMKTEAIRQGQAKFADRYKRQTVTTYYIDILPIVDHVMYQRWKQQSNDAVARTQIADYLATVFTSVALRTDTLQLGNRKLQLRMISPLFITDAALAPYILPSAGDKGINSSKALFEFRDWLVRQTVLPKYDHAMLFTGNDLYGGTDEGIRFNITKGLAFLGRMCNTHGGESSSIVEDKGAYQSEGVAAHELGHSFGATHDGDQNSCKSTDRYIMSDASYVETPTTLYNPWSFSPCSSATISQELTKLAQNSTYLNECLLKPLGDVVNRHNTVNPNDQCKTFYGPESFMCRGANVPAFSELCSDFYCHLPGTEKCERMTAATGTCCGNQKKCNAGRCEAAASGECAMDEVCPLGDQPGIVLNGKTCAQLESAYCYNDDVRLKCCDTCRQRKQSDAGCAYGDKQTGCQQADCGSTFSGGTYKGYAYDFICCSTCKAECLNRGDVTYKGISYTCEKLMLEMGVLLGCYNPGVQSNTCCKTCEDTRNTSAPVECAWGDKNEGCATLLNKPVEYNCTENNREACCKTCSIIDQRRASVATTTTTTTTSTTTPTTTTTTTATKKTTTPATTAASITTISTKTMPGNGSPRVSCSVYINMVFVIVVVLLCRMLE